MSSQLRQQAAQIKSIHAQIKALMAQISVIKGKMRGGSPAAPSAPARAKSAPIDINPTT